MDKGNQIIRLQIVGSLLYLLRKIYLYSVPLWKNFVSGLSDSDIIYHSDLIIWWNAFCSKEYFFVSDLTLSDFVAFISVHVTLHLLQRNPFFGHRFNI